VNAERRRLVAEAVADLVERGYLEARESPVTSHALTEKGRELLNWIRERGLVGVPL